MSSAIRPFSGNQCHPYLRTRCGHGNPGSDPRAGLNEQRSYKRAPTSGSSWHELRMKSCLQISVFLIFWSFLLIPQGLPSNRSFQGIGPATEMRTGLLTHPAVSVNIAFDSSSSSYLQILLILPARPPRQLELAKMWAENWSMGGKVSNGLILNSKHNVACCTVHPRVHVFPFHSSLDAIELPRHCESRSSARTY